MDLPLKLVPGSQFPVRSQTQSSLRTENRELRTCFSNNAQFVLQLFDQLLGNFGWRTFEELSFL